MTSTVQRQDRAREKEIKDRLHELGRGQMSDDQFVYGADDKFTLPARYEQDPKSAVVALAKLVDAQEKRTDVNRTFLYRPWDGAAAFARALYAVFGTAGIGLSTFTFFGEKPPQIMTVPTGPSETDNVQVPWGKVELPVLETVFVLGATMDKDNGMVFTLTANTPKRNKAKVEGFYTMVGDELKNRSIYRGKSFYGTSADDMPVFLDPNKLNPADVIYSDDVMIQLQGSVWAPIEHASALKAEKRALKRAVLLAGEYGTGKSLAGNLTAQRANANGWTFIHVRPGKDNVLEALQTAKLYQPAVVFVEDVDSESRKGDDMRLMLEAFDGITAKHTDIVVVMTTNHPDKIHPGMLRPGRMDAVIKFEGLDRAGVEALFRRVTGDRLASDVDWNAVHVAVVGFPPAYLKEVAGRAVLYQLSSGSKKITTSDLVGAAHGLRDQLDLMVANMQPEDVDTLSVELAKLTRQAAADAVVEQTEGRMVEDHDADFGYRLVFAERDPNNVRGDG